MVKDDFPVRKIGIGVAALFVVTSSIFIAPAANAAPITVTVTASPYNAVGNGTTNDRVAIQNALNAVGANPGGGTVIVPSGQTFLTGGLKIPSDTTLQVDGILKQSQVAADYGTTVILGKFTGSGVQYDQSMLHNDPFVFSDGTTNAGLSGAGTIQLTTHGAGGNSTIFTMAVGFLNASNFVIEDVNIRGASSFNVAIYGSNNGVLQDTDILGTVVNTDGISVVNSQHILVTGNTVEVDDDGMYAVTRIIDPRDYDPTSWWTRRIHQPTQFVEFSDNHVDAVQGFALRGTINGVTDLREVETTDIWVHDNYLEGRGIDPVGCWSTTERSPMTRYTFEDNTYVDGNGGNTTFSNCTLTDFNNDFGFRSSATMINGDFEATGDAWWSPAGDAGAVVTGSTTLVAAARTASSAFTGYVGYIQNYGAGHAELAQGLGLVALPVPAALTMPNGSNGAFTLSADVVTSGNAARLFAWDNCTGTLLGSQSVSVTTKTRVSLTFPSGTTCSNIRMGIDNGSSTSGWALIDNVKVDHALIDSASTAVTYVGTWTPFTNTPTLDLKGTRSVGRTANATATMSFEGERAWIIGVKGPSSGIIEVRVDGVLTATIDAYAVTSAQSQIIYDTGVVNYGVHTVQIKLTGTKRAAATDFLFGFDALLVDPFVIDDNDLTKVTYAGSWGLYTNTPADNIKGTRHVGTSTGATATMSFSGSRAWIVSSVGPAVGKFEVWVDGVLNATVDCYGPAVVQGLRLWDSGTLTSGNHTVQIKVTGTKNALSTDTKIGFDALLVDHS